MDPATSAAGEFQVGVDAAGGHLAAIETVPVSSKPSLVRMGLLTDFTPDQGALVNRDIALDLVADTQFAITGAAASANANIDLANLEVALGYQVPNRLSPRNVCSFCQARTKDSCSKSSARPASPPLKRHNKA